MNNEKKKDEVEVGLTHTETVIQTVMTLGGGSTIIKELADEAAAAFDALPAIRAAATGADQNRPKKRWELYKDYHEADAARAAEKIIMSVTWAIIGWLYMDVIEGESRLDYLRRCEQLRILKADGYKELKRLEKQSAKK